MKNSIALAQRTKLSKDPIDDIFSLLPSIEQKRKAAGLTPIINLCVGEPHLPVNTTIIERMQRYLSQTSITHDFNYNNLQGTEACRKSIQLLYQQYYPHVHYTLDELMISNGATQGIWNAFNCLLDPGDEVIAFEPYYSIYHTQAQLLDAKLLKIPTAHHQFRPDMSALRTILASRPSIKLLCLNFPNNPTGVSLSMDEVSQLCETLNHYPQLAILIDDVNRELTDTPYSILDVDPALKSRSIVINSASKGLIGAPSLRAGMVASNAEWIKEMTVIQAANVTSVSRLTEQILMEGIDLVVNNDIAYQQWIQQSRNEYKQNVLFMRDA